MRKKALILICVLALIGCATDKNRTESSPPQGLVIGIVDLDKCFARTTYTYSLDEETGVVSEFVVEQAYARIRKAEAEYSACVRSQAQARLPIRRRIRDKKDELEIAERLPRLCAVLKRELRILEASLGAREQTDERIAWQRRNEIYAAVLAEILAVVEWDPAEFGCGLVVTVGRPRARRVIHDPRFDDPVVAAASRQVDITRALMRRVAAEYRARLETKAR